MKAIRGLLLIAAAAAHGLPACTDDASASSGQNGEPYPDECADIITACHYKDTGDPGRINDCHTVAHDGERQACADAIADGCIRDCEAAPLRDGGTWSVAGAGGAGAAAGGSGTGGAGGGAGTGAAGAGGSGGVGKCLQLSSICHGAGDMGPRDECHDVGHSLDAAACEAKWDECVALCTADAG